MGEVLDWKKQHEDKEQENEEEDRDEAKEVRADLMDDLLANDYWFDHAAFEKIPMGIFWFDVLQYYKDDKDPISAIEKLRDEKNTWRIEIKKIKGNPDDYGRGNIAA